MWLDMAQNWSCVYYDCSADRLFAACIKTVTRLNWRIQRTDAEMRTLSCAANGKKTRLGGGQEMGLVLEPATRGIAAGDWTPSQQPARVDSRLTTIRDPSVHARSRLAPDSWSRYPAVPTPPPREVLECRGLLAGPPSSRSPRGTNATSEAKLNRSTGTSLVRSTERSRSDLPYPSCDARLRCPLPSAFMT
jgi:hypothetical protein